MQCRTWKKDSNELIDYDSQNLVSSNLDINSKGYILRSDYKIFFFFLKKQNELLLEINKDENSIYEIITNDCRLDENKNIETNNNSWFLLRKKITGENLKYKIKQGDIIRFGRITCRIKEIVINKKIEIDDNNINNNSFKGANIDNNNNIINQTGERTQRKEIIPKINSLKLSAEMYKFNLIKSNTKENLDNTRKEEVKDKLKLTKTIPLDYGNSSNKKNKIPKLCKICYGEEENKDNPLVQPCKCSGSLRYIHLDCLKQWLNTKSCTKVHNNERYYIYLVKQVQCEICKSKFPDFIKYKDNIFEVLELSTEFKSYCILEILTLDKESRRYLFVLNLDINNKIKLGRGHESHLSLNDISVSRVHSLLTIDNKNIFLEDNNSKFGTLILVQTPLLRLTEDLPLFIQIGRTYLECKVKNQNFRFCLCCGVSEKPDLNYYFQQNSEKKQPNLMKLITIKSELDFSDEYEINEKDKKSFFEEEKNNDKESKSFYDNCCFGNTRIRFAQEDNLNNDNKTYLNNKEEENKDNNIEDIKENKNETESIVLESESGLS